MESSQISFDFRLVLRTFSFLNPSKRVNPADFYGSESDT